MSEPKAVRIALCIQYSDGVVREFACDCPYQFDLTLTHPDWSVGALHGPLLDVVPIFRPAALEFSLQPGNGHPITMTIRRQSAVAEPDPEHDLRVPGQHRDGSPAMTAPDLPADATPGHAVPDLASAGPLLADTTDLQGHLIDPPLMAPPSSLNPRRSSRKPVRGKLAGPDLASCTTDACCDLHGRNCEPPGELCCCACTEARHNDWTTPSGLRRHGHPAGETCSNPDLSGSGTTDGEHG
jgi:hypothetical protein